MSDIASLGLAVDSSQVKTATGALDQFSASATKAERAASATVAAMSKGKPGAREFAEGFRAADAAQSQYTASANKVVDMLSNQYARLNMTARQWQIFQNVQRAGETLNSAAGQNIAKMTGALYDLEQAHKKAAAAANENNKSSSQVAVAAGKISGARLAVASALGVFGLTFATLMPLAQQFYGYLVDKAGPDTEKTFKEQDRLLKIIKGSFDSATGAAKNFYEQSKAVTELQLRQQELSLQAQLKAQTSQALSGTTRFKDLGGFFSGFFGGEYEKTIKPEFAAFENALFRLQRGFRDGAPDVQRFQEEVAKIGLSSPALQKAAADLVTATGDAAKTAAAIEQVRAALKSLEGNPLNSRERGILGLPQDQSGENLAQQWLRQTDAIGRRTAAILADAAPIGRSSDGLARLRQQELERRKPRAANDNAAKEKAA